MSDPATHRYVGPYQLLTQLGAGGMSEVFRARDTRSNELVAIKRLRVEIAEQAVAGDLPEGSGQQARQRFQREARTAARLDHPAIVKVLDFISEQGADWLVMELVDGQTLRTILRQGPIAPERAVTLAREIAAGLTEAHDKGVVHRDLKTENVLVDRKGHIKIVDFGLAKRIAHSETLTGAQSILGTFRAMSPEQVRGEALDPRSDLFSFGILLYEMVCGCSPFAHSNDLEAMRLILGERQLSAIERNPDVPAPLSNLIDQLLAKDPNLRPRSAREVSRALDRTLGSAGTGPASAKPGSNDSGRDATLPGRDSTLPEPGVTPAGLGTPATREVYHWPNLDDEETIEQRTTPIEQRRRSRPTRRTLGLALAAVAALGAVWTAATWPRALGLGLALTGALDPPAEALRLLDGEETATADWSPRRPIDDPVTREAFLEGLRHFGHQSREGNSEARRQFRRAVELEPSFAAGHAWLAATYGTEYGSGWNTDPALLDRHSELVDRAYLLDPLEPRVHLELASGAIARGQWSKALQHTDTALELAPDDRAAHGLRSIALAAEGRRLEGIEALREALRPGFGEPSSALTALALIQWSLGRERQATRLLERLRSSNPDLVSPRAALAIRYERSGDLDRARQMVREIRDVNPDLTAGSAVEGFSVLAADGSRTAARRVASLRRAGLP